MRERAKDRNCFLSVHGLENGKLRVSRRDENRASSGTRCVILSSRVPFESVVCLGCFPTNEALKKGANPRACGLFGNRQWCGLQITSSPRCRTAIECFLRCSRIELATAEAQIASPKSPKAVQDESAERRPYVEQAASASFFDGPNPVAVSNWGRNVRKRAIGQAAGRKKPLNLIEGGGQFTSAPVLLKLGKHARKARCGPRKAPRCRRPA